MVKNGKSSIEIYKIPSLTVKAKVLFNHPDFTIWGGFDAYCPLDEGEKDRIKAGHWDVVLAHKDGTIIHFDGCSNCGAITVKADE